MTNDITIKEDWKGEAIKSIVNKLARGYKEDIDLCDRLITKILETPTKITVNHD